MKLRIAVLLPLLALAWACPPGQRPSTEAADGGEIAAHVDGEAITVDELDRFIMESLFREETRGRNPAKLYEARSEALSALVRERAIEGEAARRGITPEELIEAEAAALGPVTDEEIESFYRENKERVGDRSLDDLRDRIRGYLESQRSARAVEALEGQVDVEIALEPPRFEVAADGPSAGPEDAPVTVVEFSDFQCPFCERASDVVQALRERYPEQVRVVYKHFPLEHIHGQARAAAEASLCAADQGEFWGYHDALFENRQALDDEDLVRYARELELDVASFEQCLEGRTHRATVDAHLAQGRDLGVTGTPAFFVNGLMLTGAKPLEAFTELIDAELQRLEDGREAS